MGGVSRFFDLNQANQSLRFLGQKRHDDGFEAPRNSLEISTESTQDYHPIHEDIPYSCQVNNPSMKIHTYPSESPMKSFLDDELSIGSSNRHSAPSVVARLMGMDTMPSEMKSTVQAKERREESSRKNIPRTEPTEIYSDHKMQLGSTPFKQLKQELLPIRSTKPQQREHPQEELLQKFKKEFEAWQTSKVWENSRTIDSGSKTRVVKDSRLMAQDNLNREKLSRYADAKRYYTSTKPEITTWQGSDLKKEAYTSKHEPLISKDEANKFDTNDYVHIPEKNLDRSFSSTRIVILRPSSEGENDIDSSFIGSSKRIGKEGSMEDFLEEVKERLKQEVQGKARIRGTETETSITERPTDPKQIARHIAKQIRESVTMDVRPPIVKSASTRSYRGDTGPDSPELITRDTRKLFSDRLKNVLKNKTKVGAPLISDGRSKEETRLKPMYDFSEMGKKVNYRESKKAVTDLKTKSYRSDHERSGSFDIETASQRNLVRSFSAPVSGTAFQRLLLEDQHVSTGAHIRRKHELDHVSEEAGKNRKDGFNLKDRVSSLKHNFSLKGKLFRKKIQSAHESAAIEYDAMTDNVTTPSVVMNLGSSQDNFTEVPPSPASVSSCSFDDFFRPGHPSPDSPLKVPYVEDNLSLQGAENFNSFPEPKSLSEEVANDEPEVATKAEPYEDETDDIGQPEAYARKVLITAGLYEGHAFDQTFPKLDTLTRPMSKWVFEKVEEVYNSNEDAVEEGYSQCCGDTGLSRKMLFDLMNEALPRIHEPRKAHATFKKWIVCPVTVPHGRKLLADLMNQIRIYIDRQQDECRSLDSKVAWDLKMNPWPSKSYKEIEIAGVEMEFLILRDLIDELVSDMCP